MRATRRACESASIRLETDEHESSSPDIGAANLRFWQNMANNRDGAFAVEDVVVFGDRANIRWRYRFVPGSRNPSAEEVLMEAEHCGKADGIWFVTGASRGFGRAVALAALRRGGRVAAALPYMRRAEENDSEWRPREVCCIR